MSDELLKMEPSRKKRKSGEIFVIKPRENMYFYGRVMRTQVQSSNGFINGWNLIYIYKVSSADGSLPPEPLRPDQLLFPMVVNNQAWYQGYFKTIGISPVSEEDFARDAGFRVFKLTATDKYVDVEGNELDFVPRTWTPFALGGFGAVEKLIKIYLRDLEEIK